LLQGALDNMNLFQVITIMAFFMLLPVSILIEGLPILPHNLAAAVSCTLAVMHAMCVMCVMLYLLGG
jgi:hypothetical protein